MKKSIFKIILIVAGLLHVLFFFVLPFAVMYESISTMGDLASALGLNTDIPARLTGRSILSFAELADYAGAQRAMFTVAVILPLVLGIIIALINLAFNGRRSSVLTIILSFIQIFPYLLIRALCSGLEGYYYETSGGSFGLITILIIIQIIVAILAVITCRSKKNA
ncbi:MAG: hypothetical protein LUG54_03695 [Clostridiales bacterium]|nr:hypothetical protein [Clostridiales bacterium]